MKNNCDFSKQYEGFAIPFKGNDIDTDRIIPARFLKEITFDNMGSYLFNDVKYFPNGDKNPECPLNQACYDKASIMLVEENFGCGSSREHAPQAIKRYGINCIIGLSFAEIFSGNCRAIGVPTLTVSKKDIENLIRLVEKTPALKLSINLLQKSISLDSDVVISITNTDQQLQPFLDNTWNALGQLKKNHDKIIRKANQLPYLNSFVNF